MKTILITGAAGFLGSHLCEYYLQKNHIVLGIDNFSTGQEKNIGFLKNKFQDRFYFLQKNVCDQWDDVHGFIRKQNLNFPVLVFHFASPASVPHYQKLNLETLAVNSLGLQHCLEFSSMNNSRTIFASTSEIYGDPLQSPQSEDYLGNVNTIGPRSCYDESKRFGEALITHWNLRHNSNHGIVRIFNTYGPRMALDDGRVIIQILNQALQNKPLTIYGDGNQTRSFCYVNDLILGIELYAHSTLKAPLNLGRSDEISILELAQLIQRLTETTSKIEFVSLPIDDPQSRVPNLEKAKILLNYEAKIDLTAGLLKMISWLKHEIQ